GASVEPVEIRVGGQARVEDQFLRRRAGLLLPEIDEAQDLPGLLGLGDAGPGVAEDALAGVPGQEGQDALLAAAAAGKGVGFPGARPRYGPARCGNRGRGTSRASGPPAGLP